MQAAEGHVLILSPLSVSWRVQLMILMPLTFSSWLYLPRLPILIPCPGPHVTLSTRRFFIPSPTETQSSPVEINELMILIPSLLPTWIPSVLGLSAGAMILTSSNVMFFAPITLMWKFFASKEVMPLIFALVTKSKRMLCSTMTPKHQQTHLNREFILYNMRGFLTMGSFLQLKVLWQLLTLHAAFPSPSKTPPPFNLNPSMLRKATHFSFPLALPSAFTVP